MFIFDLHMYCDDMQIIWDMLPCPPPPPPRRGDGMFKMYRPSWCAGSGSKCQTVSPTLTLVLEDLMILWLAANY